MGVPALLCNKELLAPVDKGLEADLTIMKMASMAGRAEAGNGVFWMVGWLQGVFPG
jgi:hypothetical protein